MLMPPIRMYHCDILFSCQLVMKLVRYLGAYYPSTHSLFFFFFTLAIKSPQFLCMQLKAWTAVDGRSLPPTPTTSLPNYGGWRTTHWKGPSSGTARARPSSSTSSSSRGRSCPPIPALWKTWMPLRPPTSRASCSCSTCTASGWSPQWTETTCPMPTVPPGLIINSSTQTLNRTPESSRRWG